VPTLRERVDESSVRIVFLPLPKGRKRGSGMTFFGGDPVASLESAGAAPPYRWVNGKPELVAFQDVKKVNGRGGADDQLAGFWYTPKQDERAIVWSLAADGTLAGAELHPEGWQKSVALACGGGQQVGYGYRKFVRDPDRALLWTGSSNSVIELFASDRSRGTMAHAVADGIQGGKVNYGGPAVHGCLWHGTSETFDDLHPAGMLSSEVLGVGDGEQVGSTMDEEFRMFAALWKGSAASHVNLGPEGFRRSGAYACARGFQVGWVAEHDRGMLTRATLWSGSPDERLDLQQHLPEPWNVSSAIDLHVDGDRLRVIGSATQAVKSGGYEMNAGQVPVVWEIPLRMAEPPARRRAAVSVPPPNATAEPESPERRIDRAVEEFSGAVIAKDFKAAHARLAPWIAKKMTATKLRAFVKEHLLDDSAPADFQSSGNDITLEHLRELGEHAIPDAVTADNFRQWMMLDLTPDPDAGSELDYILRLWLVVVEINGTMKIGYLEPEY
jgi:hypothetical protein